MRLVPETETELANYELLDSRTTGAERVKAALLFSFNLNPGAFILSWDMFVARRSNKCRRPNHSHSLLSIADPNLSTGLCSA